LRKLWFIILIVGIIGTILAINFDNPSYGDQNQTQLKQSTDNFINSSDRVLIIAPHPDDEAIGAAGVIRYSVEHKIPVKVVIVTDGDVGDGVATERHNESVKAMDLLGLNQSDLIFLGYRDCSLPRLLIENWDSNTPYDKNGVTTNINYPYSYQKNVTYSGTNLEQNLEEIIGDFQPTVILYTDSEDEQIDHWATYAFVEYATARINYQGAKYTYLVHDPPDWPSPRIYQPEDSLNPPRELTLIGYEWITFPLNSDQERLKETAVDTYTSQINSYSYIQSFIRKNELFGIDPVVNSTVSNESLDFFSGDQFPPNVVKEPKKNDRGKGSIRTREIAAVGFEMDKNNTWISLRLDENISSSESYEVHILPLDVANPGAANSGRIDINIQNGRANYQKFSDNSFTSGEPKVQTVDNGLIIEMPTSAFNGVNSFLISADIEDGTTLLDWTAWREVKIVR